jgi:hypothetical protein
MAFALGSVFRRHAFFAEETGMKQVAGVLLLRHAEILLQRLDAGGIPRRRHQQYNLLPARPGGLRACQELARLGFRQGGDRIGFNYDQTHFRALRPEHRRHEKRGLKQPCADFRSSLLPSWNQNVNETFASMPFWGAALRE